MLATPTRSEKANKKLARITQLEACSPRSSTASKNTPGDPRERVSERDGHHVVV
jgi:hypothetical protein